MAGTCSLFVDFKKRMVKFGLFIDAFSIRGPKCLNISIANNEGNLYCNFYSQVSVFRKFTGKKSFSSMRITVEAGQIK